MFAQTGVDSAEIAMRVRVLHVRREHVPRRIDLLVVNRVGAGRRLQPCRDHVEGGEREPELDVVHAVFGSDEGKQGRKQENVEMADEMRSADQADDPGIARRLALGPDLDRLRHGGTLTMLQRP